MLSAASTVWGDANGCLYTCLRVRVRRPPRPTCDKVSRSLGTPDGPGRVMAWLGRRGTELCGDVGGLFAVRAARSFV